MEPQLLTKQLEGASTKEEARALLEANRRTPGLSEAYLNRVLELFSADHSALARLGRWAPLVVELGDDKSRAYRALGIAERVQGRWLPSAKAFLKAGEAAVTPADRLSFQTGAIDALAQAGKVDEACQLAERLHKGLTKLGEKGLAARVWPNLANAFLSQDRYKEARAALKGIPETLEEEGRALEALSARLALSTAQLYGGDPNEARAEAVRAAEQAKNLGRIYAADQALMNVAHAAMLLGRADESLQLLLELQHRFSDDPIEKARVLEFMGDAHSRLNLWPEAIDAYQLALSMSDVVTPRHRAHLSLGLGQALLASGKAAEAKVELKDAVSRYRKLGNKVWEAAALTVEAEALYTEGSKKANDKARMAASVAREAHSPFHLARALLVQSLCCADVEALNESAKLIKKFGFGGLEWRIHAGRAKIEPNRALSHYRKMFEAILRERAYASSKTSRASYLRDKADLVRDYLEELLAKPTASHVQEALSVVERSRSVALLDELVSAKSSSLNPDVLEKIYSLRQELETAAATDVASDGVRALVERTPSDLHGFQRRWLEQTHQLIQSVETPITVRRSDTASFVTTRQSIHVLARGTSWKIGMSPEELDRKLKWLQFELLAPMVDRNSDPEPAARALVELGRELLLPWAFDAELGGISPDGLLWRVPWTACCDALGIPRLELRLHPGLGGTKATLRPSPVTALWVAEHPDLQHAASEANAFLEKFPNSMVARSAGEAREMLGEKIDLLHVVAHAKHRWSNPMFSSIEFEDGSIFATEIAQSRLEANIVVLSACETGAMSITVQDEPDGFARAFLGRGAQAVVGSAWPLDDEAAALVSNTLYDNLIKGRNVLDSLAEARECARSWRAHPYFWASQLLYGGYQS